MAVSIPHHCPKIVSSRRVDSHALPLWKDEDSSLIRNTERKQISEDKPLSSSRHLWGQVLCALVDDFPSCHHEKQDLEALSWSGGGGEGPQVPDLSSMDPGQGGPAFPELPLCPSFSPLNLGGFSTVKSCTQGGAQGAHRHRSASD